MLQFGKLIIKQIMLMLNSMKLIKLITKKFPILHKQL